MLPRPYMGSYSGKNIHQLLQENWILAFEKSIETFIMMSISDMTSIKHWHNLGKVLDTTKQKIPKKCRIGDTCFTSLETIVGKLYTIHPKNINHVHKDVTDIMSVINILGTDVHGDKTVFKMELP